MLGLTFEEIKTIGSIGGLISACFLLWDRFLKQRPDVEFVPDKFLGVGQIYEKLRITNRSTSGLWVRNVRVYPPRMSVAADDSFEGIFKASETPGFRAILEPEGTKLFPIIGVSDDWKPCVVVVFWRLNRRPGRWQVPVLRFISPRILNRMSDDPEGFD